jgi:acyl-CoA synthetase (AMP-forming)/AMP-acid ligase II
MTTFGDLIRRNGLYWASKEAYIDERRRVTWAAYNARTDALGHAMRGLGISPGDRVAIVGSDCVELAETFGACAKIGAVRVGLNPRLAPPEIVALAMDCAPKIVFVHTNYTGLTGALPTLRVGAEGSAIRIVEFGGSANSEYEQLIRAQSDQPALAHTPHDVAMIAYTTGSTGLPKGAVYNHEKMVASILYIALCEGIDAECRWLHAMPAAGIPLMHMMRNIFHAGATIIVGRWDADRALHLIESERTTNTVLVPTMLNSLLESSLLGNADVSSMKLIGYGASPLPPATIRDAMAAFNRPFLQMFGTTELMGMSMMLLPEDHRLGLSSKPEILASAGKPLPYVDLRTVDEEGKVLPQGETGELIIRSEVAFSGYWNAPEKDAETIRSGWIHTGDTARLDEDGYVYLSDRMKFRIKSGGYTIFPTEVENVLAEHPAINEVAVVGLPDKHWGERIHAVVSLTGGATVAPEELQEFCRGKIATFKQPKSVEIWAELPKGPTGKIQKRTILDFYASQESGSAKT